MHYTKFKKKKASIISNCPSFSHNSSDIESFEYCKHINFLQILSSEHVYGYQLLVVSKNDKPYIESKINFTGVIFVLFCPP